MIYTLWLEEGSGEELGWYLAKVLFVNDNGDAKLKYRKGGLIEEVNLAGIQWIPEKGKN